MPRNRIIYQSEALYVGPSPATGYHLMSGAGAEANSWAGPTGVSKVKQLQRVQSANYGFNVERTDVNQFGQLAAIDRVILKSPTVSLDFDYILSNLSNEYNLGLSIASGNSDSLTPAISGLLNKIGDERNYFIRTVTEGNDATNNLDSGVANGVIGIGNAYISSINTEASVGDFPKVSVSVEGMNMVFQNGLTGNYIPGIKVLDGSSTTNYYSLPSTIANVGIGSGNAISALRPGDLTLSIGSQGLGGGVDFATMNAQKFSLSLDLKRTPIERLGTRFAFTKEVDFPLTISLSVDAQVTDMVTGNLALLLDNDTQSFSPSITIKSPTDSSLVMAKYILKGCKLTSQQFSSDIGSNKTVSLTFDTQVGGPQDTANGLFINGQY